MSDNNNKNSNTSIVKSNNSVISRVSAKIETTNKILIERSGLKAWWDSLDQFWKEVIFINLTFAKSNIDYGDLVIYSWGSNTHETYEWFSKKKLNLPVGFHIIDLELINSLEVFNVNKYGLNDLSPISRIQSLTHLQCRDNKIVDLSQISDLRNLIYLNLSNNLISDIKPLRRFKSLKVLWLKGNKITNIEPLSDLKNLESLYYIFDGETDLKPIKYLSKIKDIAIDIKSPTNISDLVKYAPQIERLELRGGMYNDEYYISKFNFLKALSISDKHIQNLDFISSLNHLEYLSLNFTSIESIDQLKYLNNCLSLDCSDNKIRSLSPLRQLQYLFELLCNNNQISSLEPIMHLNNLTTLECRGNNIPIKEIELFKQLHPSCEIEY